MGIKNLFASLPGLTLPVGLSALQGKRAGIDANGWMFQAYHGQCMSDPHQNVTGLIRMFDHRIRMLEKYSIKVHSPAHLRFRRPQAAGQAAAQREETAAPGKLLQAGGPG